MNEEIVASAMSSFNNAALLMPDFAWRALLAAPVFIAAMRMAPEIMACFFPLKKSRGDSFAWLIEALLIGWLVLGRGNWDVIRDGAGWLPYLNVSCLFLLCRDATARLYVYNPRVPKWWREIGIASRRWIKIGALAAAIVVLAASSVRDASLISLQICGFLFGAAAGYFGRRPAQPVNYTVIIMAAVAVGISLQPEYFRFGQLGRLTFVHLGALASVIALGAVIFVFRNFKPAGFIRDNHYRYIKWFMRLGCVLALILFAMTEAVPALLGFGAAVMAAAWFAAKHADGGTNIFGLSNNLWALMMGVFGAITSMPAITVLGILCWKNNNIKNFWAGLRSVLK
jgi:hypothetical protein